MAREFNLEQLVGQHVFAEYTYKGRTAVVKGLVLEIARGRPRLRLTGNGREFDGKTIVAVVPELQTRYGVIRIAEKQGDPPGLGRWRDCSSRLVKADFRGVFSRTAH